MNEVDFSNWGITAHGYLDVNSLVTGTDVVLSAAFCGPTFIVYDYGCGTVILDTLTYGWAGMDTINQGSRGPALDNLLKYALYASSLNDDCDCNCTVPEPSSLVLFGFACVGAFGAARRRRASAVSDGSLTLSS